ncbi:MAG TPA: hypothetical protein VGW38_09235 [Chloroflexota bacterium]|nr:hypothetical protein [Chloroflexota bacterium]
MPKPFDLPDHDTMRANLYATLRRATPAELDTGEAWYDVANTFAWGLAEKHDLSPHYAAGIIAALSPGCEWERNLALAQRMAERGDCRHPYGNAIHKARAIWSGTHPEQVLGGDKVRSFYKNITTPWIEGPVTIDRHAVSCLVGRKVEGVPQRKGYYERLADVFRDVAAELGRPAHVVQAQAWLAWRRLPADPNQLTMEV